MNERFFQVSQVKRNEAAEMMKKKAHLQKRVAIAAAAVKKAKVGRDVVRFCSASCEWCTPWGAICFTGRTAHAQYVSQGVRNV